MKSQQSRQTCRRSNCNYLRADASCIVVLSLAFAMLLAVGCGPGNPLGRKAVSGKITLNGQPLKSGSIEFSPQAKDGVNSGAPITDGAYSIVTEKGLPPGKYTARIFSTMARDTSTIDMPPGPATTPAGVDLIPPEYGSQSTQTVEVTDDGNNEFNFDIATRRR